MFGVAGEGITLLSETFSLEMLEKLNTGSSFIQRSVNRADLTVNESKSIYTMHKI